MAGFSSQGPTDVDFRVKPDSSRPASTSCSSIPATTAATTAAGRSSRAPRWPRRTSPARRPSSRPSTRIGRLAQIRSAIVNTAETGVLKAFTAGTTIVTDVNIEGAGRENLLDAVNAKVGLSPVSVSFGAIPSGAGQTKSIAISLTNLTGAPATWCARHRRHDRCGGLVLPQRVERRRWPRGRRPPSTSS